MEPIIKPLNSDLLTKFGFTYDGYYWNNPMVPFRLVKADKEGTYMVDIENAPIGSTPPPISSNSQLLQLFMKTVPAYFEVMFTQMKMDPATAMPWMFQSMLNRFMKFDESLDIKVVVQKVGDGIALVAGNEVTHTLITGIQCEFDVDLADVHTDEITHERIFINPECMSYDYLNSIIPEGKVVLAVKIMLNESGEFVPFYGVGYHKPPVPVNPSMS